jgi:hypothetical protein
VTYTPSILTLKWPVYVPGYGLCKVLKMQSDGEGRYRVRGVNKKDKWLTPVDEIWLSIPCEVVASRQYLPSESR